MKGRLAWMATLSTKEVAYSLYIIISSSVKRRKKGDFKFYNIE
jgi:hypothetical protein